MSEVIYNEANYEKILKVLELLLAKNGWALLATKLFYYGVGGGWYDFEELLEERGFHKEVVWENEANKTNKRLIIKITKSK